MSVQLPKQKAEGEPEHCHPSISSLQKRDARMDCSTGSHRAMEPARKYQTRPETYLGGCWETIPSRIWNWIIVAAEELTAPK